MEEHFSIFLSVSESFVMLGNISGRYSITFWQKLQHLTEKNTNNIPQQVQMKDIRTILTTFNAEKYLFYVTKLEEKRNIFITMQKQLC